jgi:hypothetical protein
LVRKWMRSLQRRRTGLQILRQSLGWEAQSPRL